MLYSLIHRLSKNVLMSCDLYRMFGCISNIDFFISVHGSNILKYRISAKISIGLARMITILFYLFIYFVYKQETWCRCLRKRFLRKFRYLPYRINEHRMDISNRSKIFTILNVSTSLTKRLIKIFFSVMLRVTTHF